MRAYGLPSGLSPEVRAELRERLVIQLCSINPDALTVAKVMGWSAATAYSAAKDGVLPVIKTSARRSVVSTAALIELIDNPASPPAPVARACLACGALLIGRAPNTRYCSQACVRAGQQRRKAEMYARLERAAQERRALRRQAGAASETTVLAPVDA